MCEASILGIMLELGRGKLQRTVTSSLRAGLTVAQRENTLKSYRIIELADHWPCPKLNEYGIQPSSSQKVTIKVTNSMFTEAIQPLVTVG